LAQLAEREALEETTKEAEVAEMSLGSS